MTDATIVLAAIVAVVAGVRGTWSPCGLSMLSTITPLAERGRGHRYGVTAVWFVVGATIGGATLGAASAAGAALVGMAHLSAPAVLAIAAALAAVGAASDLRLFGFSLPLHPRQVDETWLRKYRAWLYGGGFGWQIGTGVATYVMTAATYLLVGLAVLTGRPVVALALCAGFGLVRGSAVLLSARASTPAELGRLHARLEQLAPASRWVAIATQIAVGVAALALAVSSPLPALVAVTVAVAATATGLAAARRRGTGRTAAASSPLR